MRIIVAKVPLGDVTLDVLVKAVREAYELTRIVPVGRPR